MRARSPDGPSWWMWPPALSIDAPIVTMLWQGLLAPVAGVTIGWPQVVVLGLSVWLSYVLDRWIEGWRLDPGLVRTARHAFHQDARWPIAGAWLAGLTVDVAIAFLWLPRRDLVAGALLVPPVLAYLLSHQFVHRHHPWRVPKEICIAGLLGAGVAVFLVARPEARLAPLFAGLLLFVSVAFANCAMISTWERAADRSHGQTSLALVHRRAPALIRAFPWFVAACGIAVAVVGASLLRDVAACAAASAVLLLAVDRVEPRVGPEAARVLADAALMTPAVLLWIPGGL